MKFLWGDTFERKGWFSYYCYKI